MSKNRYATNKDKPCNCEPFQICKFCAVIEKTEREIEKEIYDFVNANPGCFCYKTDTKGNTKGGKWIKSNPMERKGKADLVNCLWGLFVGVEVKKPGGVQSDDQKEFEKDVKAARGEYWLLESLNEFMEKFRELKSRLF